MTSFTEASAAKILIVDDEQANLRLLEFVLRRGGYAAVSSTAEPRQVCALQLQNQYDLILLDLRMPSMNGFEVMEGLSKLDQMESVAVLVLSADPSQMVAVLKAGAADFLSKPFELAEVLLRVQRLLEQAMTRRIAVSLPVPAPQGSSSAPTTIASTS